MIIKNFEDIKEELISDGYVQDNGDRTFNLTKKGSKEVEKFCQKNPRMNLLVFMEYGNWGRDNILKKIKDQVEVR